MPANIFVPLIDKHFTQREIARTIGLSLTATQYWLRKHDLKTKHGPRGICRDPSIERKCIVCGERNPTLFYGNRWNICKSCDNKRTALRASDNRLFALNLLG